MSLFVILALYTVGTAILAVKTETLTYSALWLAAMLIGVAGLFLTLGAEFLAVIQVIIYAGAVVSLILFAIMFAQHRGSRYSDPSPQVTNRARGGLLAALLVLILFVLLLGVAPWRVPPQGREGFLELGQAIFKDYLLPFEVLSVLLLAALVGAVFLAKRERPPAEAGGSGSESESESESERRQGQLRRADATDSEAEPEPEPEHERERERGGGRGRGGGS